MVYNYCFSYVSFISNLKMKKIKLAVTGCLGRMGQQIIKSVRADKNFKLNAITESSIVNKKINGLNIDLNTESTFRDVNLIIDFTVPKCTFQILKIASKLKNGLGTVHTCSFSFISINFGSPCFFKI